MNLIRRNILFISWLVLMLLVLTMAITSQFAGDIRFFGGIIFGLSAIKFIVVAYQFMEMKVAHSFWKIALLVYACIFIIVIVFLIT